MKTAELLETSAAATAAPNAERGGAMYGISASVGRQHQKAQTKKPP
jgi:hypothetical protein